MAGDGAVDGPSPAGFSEVELGAAPAAASALSPLNRRAPSLAMAPQSRLSADLSAQDAGRRRSETVETSASSLVMYQDNPLAKDDGNQATQPRVVDPAMYDFIFPRDHRTLSSEERTGVAVAADGRSRMVSSNGGAHNGPGGLLQTDALARLRSNRDFSQERIDEGNGVNTLRNRLASLESSRYNGPRSSNPLDAARRLYRRATATAQDDSADDQQPPVRVDLEDGDAMNSRVQYERESMPPFLFHPDVPLRQFFTYGLVFPLILLSVFTVPYTVAFDDFPVGVSWFIDTIFIADIFVNFCTAYRRDDGSLETDRSAIAGRYARGWFAIDLVSSFPYHVIQGSSGSAVSLVRLFRTVRLLRLIRLFRLVKIAEFFEASGLVSPSVLRFSATFLFIIASTHWIACAARFTAGNFTCRKAGLGIVAECPDSSIFSEGSTGGMLPDELDTWIKYAFDGCVRERDRLKRVEDGAVGCYCDGESLLDFRRNVRGGLNETVWPSADAMSALARMTIDTKAWAEHVRGRDDVDLDLLCYSLPNEKDYASDVDVWRKRKRVMTERRGMEPRRLYCSCYLSLNSGLLGNQYWVAVYWTTSSILGEGCEHRSLPPLLLSNFVAWFGLLEAALVFSNLASLIQNLDSLRKNFRERKEQILNFMMVRRVPQTLRERVLEHMNLSYEKNKGMENRQVLRELPRHLRNEMSLFLHRDLIDSVTIFDGCSTAFLTELLTIARNISVFRGETLCMEGDAAEEMYVVISGRLGAFRRNEFVAMLHPGQFFGVAAVLDFILQPNDQNPSSTRGLFEAQVMGLDNCELMVIARDDMGVALSRFPQDAQRIQRMTVEQPTRARRDSLRDAVSRYQDNLRRSSESRAPAGAPAAERL